MIQEWREKLKDINSVLKNSFAMYGVATKLIVIEKTTIKQVVGGTPNQLKCFLMLRVIEKQKTNQFLNIFYILETK